MSKKISEAEIEAYFVKCVEEQLGGVALKLEVKGRRGWLDRLVLLPQGLTAIVELKAHYGKLSAQQRKRIDALERLGHDVAVLPSKTSVDVWVQYTHGRFG